MRKQAVPKHKRRQLSSSSYKYLPDQSCVPNIWVYKSSGQTALWQVAPLLLTASPPTKRNWVDVESYVTPSTVALSIKVLWESTRPMFLKLWFGTTQGGQQPISEWERGRNFALNRWEDATLKRGKDYVIGERSKSMFCFDSQAEIFVLLVMQNNSTTTLFNGNLG